MWTVTDAEHAPLRRRLPDRAAAEAVAGVKWPGCTYDGDPDLGAPVIYVYDAGDEHVGFLVPPPRDE